MLNKKGLTLVEVLIAGVISFFVVLLLFVLLRSGQNRLEETSNRAKIKQKAGVVLAEIKDQIRSSGVVYSVGEYDSISHSLYSPGSMLTTPVTNRVILISDPYSIKWRGWMVNGDGVLLQNEGGSGGPTQAEASSNWQPCMIMNDTVFVLNLIPFQLQVNRRSLMFNLGGIRLKSVPSETLFLDPILVRGRFMQWRLPE